MIIPYDRDSATAYALRWALGRNPEYYNYNEIGGDCTNFVSQSIYAGSRIMNYTPDFGWYYINANDKSPSWTGVNFFYNFITNNNGPGPFGIETDLSQLLPGDVVQLGNNNGVYYHSLIITRIRNTLIGRVFYVSAHSQDARNRRLSSYSFQSLRAIHIEGVRTQ